MLQYFLPVAQVKHGVRGICLYKTPRVWYNETNPGAGLMLPWQNKDGEEREVTGYGIYISGRAYKKNIPPEEKNGT